MAKTEKVASVTEQIASAVSEIKKGRPSKRIKNTSDPSLQPIVDSINDLAATLEAESRSQAHAQAQAKSSHFHAFKKMRIKTVFAFTAVFLLIVFFTADMLVRNYQTRRTIESIVESDVHWATELANARDLLWKLRFQLPNYLLNTVEDKQQVKHTGKIYKEQLISILSNYEMNSESSAETDRAKSLQILLNKYLSNRAHFFEIVDQGKQEAAISYRMKFVNPIADQITIGLGEVIELQRASSQNKLSNLRGAFDFSYWMIGVFVLTISVTLVSMLRFLLKTQDASRREIEKSSTSKLKSLISMLESEKERLQCANKEVEKNKTLLTAIIENIPVAICLKDAKDKFKVKLWNKTAEQLFEVQREAILEKSVHDLWPKEQADLYLAADEKVSREGVMVDVPEEPSQSKTRGLLYFHTKKLPLTIKGSPDSKYLLCICDDITETKRKDEKIIATLRQLETVADSLPGFISRCDLDGRYTFANKIYEKWYGIPKNEVVGRTQREVLPPKSYAQAEPNIKRAMKGERFSFEAVTTTKAGDDLNVFVSHIPDYDSQGKLSGYFNVVLDITQIKQTQKQLLQSSKMSSLGEMAGGIAHEINNPLAVILGKAGGIKRRMENGSFEVAKVCEDLAKIENYSERIAKIIKGLRSFSRNSENDPMTVAKISTIVEDTLELCKERFRNHGVDLRVSFDPALELECRPSQVAQILINLLGNAHDAIEKSDEKWVALEIVSEGDLIRIKVTDSGNGIPKEVVDRMMEPFFTTKEVGKGTGLGLSISKGIAEDHGGQLRYDYYSKNTAFVLEIPRKQPNANSREKKAA